MKTSIFAKTSLKCSFSFQTLLRNHGISLFWKIKDLCGSFSGKTLWQGYFNFLLQNEDIGLGLVRSKTSWKKHPCLWSAFISWRKRSSAEMSIFRLFSRRKRPILKIRARKSLTNTRQPGTSNNHRQQHPKINSQHMTTNNKHLPSTDTPNKSKATPYSLQRRASQNIKVK